MNSFLAFVIWCPLQWILGVTAWWAGHHLGMRLATGRPVFTDSHCDRCGHRLVWSQLPIVGQRFGCRRCGHRGPANATRNEVVAGTALLAVALLTRPTLAPFLFVALVALAVVVGLARHRIDRSNLRRKQHLTNHENN